MTKTTLIIARHGNTFGPGDIPTRVGARTDLSLVAKGIEQGKALGRELENASLRPNNVYVSSLQRTQQTAKAALKEMSMDLDLQVSDIFNEIDYGPDENQTEDKVIARIGKAAIEAWDNRAVPPQGWLVDPDKIIADWHRFTVEIAQNCAGKTILAVTSNGTARFAPNVLNNKKNFCQNNSLKLSTGAYGVFEYSAETGWVGISWNIRPPL